MSDDFVHVRRFSRIVEVDLAEQTVRSVPRALPSCTIGGAFAGLVVATLAREPDGWGLLLVAVAAACSMLFFGLPFLERGEAHACFRTCTVSVGGGRPSRFTNVDVSPARSGGGIALTVLTAGRQVELLKLGGEDESLLRVLVYALVRRDPRRWHELGVGLRDCGLQSVVVWLAIFAPVLVAAMLVAVGFDGNFEDLGFE